ncbi:MAG: AI-2E family transporter [Campylobacter sp.]|nr:AI-2E family transporter [Campylobacter sp.]
MRLQMVFVSLASIIIILAGIKAASAIIVPFLLATFIAIILSPVIELLEKIKIPRVISFIFVTICFMLVLAVIGNIAVTTMFDFLHQLPELMKKFEALLVYWSEKLTTTEFSEFINFDPAFVGINTSGIVATSSSLLKKTSSIMTMWFFVLLLVAFMLFESPIIKEKVAYMDTKSTSAKIYVHMFIKNLKQYLLVKTIISISTGVFIGLCLWRLGTPYALLWGIVAFILNYIPTIGSIVAAIPAVFVSLLTGDMIDTFWVIMIYIMTNTIFGTILEPRLVGEELGISTITVLFSLLLWGYVLGLGGLFLAVPLTMSVQIALKINPKTEYLAVLLSNKVEKRVN